MDEPSTSTLLASVSCGTPSRSASIAASTPVRASVDSEPRMTRSKPIFLSVCGQRVRGATARPSRAARRPTRCTALSAPMARALRIGVGGLVRAHGEDGHLTAVGLLDRQRLLDRVLVELVDDAVGGLAVERLVVGPQLALGRRVGDLLHADDDVHGRWPTSRVRVRHRVAAVGAGLRYAHAGYVHAMPRLPGARGRCDSG